MHLFIDTANIHEIRDAVRWGVVAGATTNPKLLSNEGASFDLRERILEIADLVQGPVSVEVISERNDEMLAEARRYASWHPNIVVKMPMSLASMEIVNVLQCAGVRTNVTGLMAVNQAVLATLAGASYVSFFFGRICDLGTDPVPVIQETAALLSRQSRTQIIVGSIRNLMDINRSFLAGADYVTVPYACFKQMAHHPKTVETIQEFNTAWANVRSQEPASAVSVSVGARG